MKTRALMGSTGGTLAATMLAVVVGFSAPTYGAIVPFTLPAGAQSSGGSVAASGSFNTNGTNVILTLQNDLAVGDIKNVAQLISDISFTAVGGSGGAGNVTPATSYLNVVNNVGVAGVAPLTPAWTLENPSGSNYHLTAIGCTQPCVGPEGLIINGGVGSVYTANSSINNNDPHNPFANGTSTFTLGLLSAGITAFTNIVISFGTTAGDNVAVPIPAAVWLFASGLLGLIGIARRKYTGAVTASPMAA